jgi:hypothetical protein
VINEQEMSTGDSCVFSDGRVPFNYTKYEQGLIDNSSCDRVTLNDIKNYIILMARDLIIIFYEFILICLLLVVPYIALLVNIMHSSPVITTQVYVVPLL